MSLPNTAISTATSADEAIYFIFKNAMFFGRILRSCPLSQAARNKGTQYCMLYQNPLTGASVKLGDRRILEIYDSLPGYKPAPRCAAEASFIAIVSYANTIACVLRSFYQAMEAREKKHCYCKTVTIPATLFPNVPDGERRVTMTWPQIINIACRALTCAPLPSTPIIQVVSAP